MMMWEILINHNIKIDIVDFVALLPRIAPRLQTISSSNLLNPDVVTLTNSLMIDRLKNDRVKIGVCSKYF